MTVNVEIVAHFMLYAIYFERQYCVAFIFRLNLTQCVVVGGSFFLLLLFCRKHTSLGVCQDNERLSDTWCNICLWFWLRTEGRKKCQQIYGVNNFVFFFLLLVFLKRKFGLHSFEKLTYVKPIGSVVIIFSVNHI